MEKELKKQMVNLHKRAIKELGEGADVLITAFNDGHCGSIMHGSSQNIAHSLFALIHDQKNKMSMDLYRIIKLVVLNIINNESPYAMDLLTSILNTPNHTEQSERSENDQKAVLINMSSNNEPN